MSSFFTLPESQRRKRKRKQDTTDNRRPSKFGSLKTSVDNDSISGSESSGDDVPSNESGVKGDKMIGDAEDIEEDDDFEDEDPAAKRVRLAEQYLANTKQEVLDEFGFDAAEIDQEHLRRRMGDRLKEDTAESRGKLYRWIADDMEWISARRSTTRVDGKSITGVALHGRYAYTAGKDMAIVKWELDLESDIDSETVKPKRPSRKPRRVTYTRGNPRRGGERDFRHHHRAILCIAVSPDGKFVATGGADKKLIIWDASTLKPLKVFFEHRDWVTGLAFRRGTNQMFSVSKDRDVKVWSLDELAYVETLFGHQDEVVDVSALAEEKCVSVGARDRTARLWRVVEQNQLIFRGGGHPGKSNHKRLGQDHELRNFSEVSMKAFDEGSMDRVACIDNETFVTGSDNGSLSIWNIHKKKPVFTWPLAHGVDPPAPIETLSAELFPDEDTVFRMPAARWITALKALPFSNILLSGSWDGYIRVWRISHDKRQIEALGPLGGTETDVIIKSAIASSGSGSEMDHPISEPAKISGVVNELSIEEVGDRAAGGFVVAVAVAKEPRLGRWTTINKARNSLVVFRVLRKA